MPSHNIDKEYRAAVVFYGALTWLTYELAGP